MVEQLVGEQTGRPVRSWRGDLPVAATGAAAAAVGWAVARASGLDLAVRAGGGTQHVNVVSVVVTAVVVAMAAGGLLRLLERRTKAAARLFGLIAGGVLVASSAGPIGARSLAAGLVLAGLHVVVAAVVVIGLLRRRIRP